MKLENLLGTLKSLAMGRARDLSDRNLFHNLSLVAVLAWVGLGADGLSSSCYGPEETFRALGTHTHLAIFVALACVATIAILCASYRQIIELFPSGGGGYLVASKLLSPTAGVVSGSALLVDYVLTITISVASGSDALFSILPVHWAPWKPMVNALGILILTGVNLRGVKESVLLWSPVFFLFLLTHGTAILMGLFDHTGSLPAFATSTAAAISQSKQELGWLGLIGLVLRAYSMGAGTYTGIEAVSNGMPVLREPRVQTGKRTMTYMALSLSLTVLGLLLAYLLHHVEPVEGRTLNAVLFDRITAHWPPALGHSFVSISMLSATALLFIAAQAGFLDGPRVLANMALDRWFPTRFASLSDRLVNRNGILLMGTAALLAMILTHGRVDLLVILYSLNVFLTFSLSQAGMVRHHWTHRDTAGTWKRKLSINAVGLAATTFILISLCTVKFFEGGWVTLLLTGAVVWLAFKIRKHYRTTGANLRRLDELLHAATTVPVHPPRTGHGRTALVLVNGFNGLGLHTYLGVARLFPDTFSRFVFLQVGAVDAGTFKGAAELDRLRSETAASARRYQDLAQRSGFEADAVSDVSTDVVRRIEDLAHRLLQQHPQAVVFAGQLAFQTETAWTRWLHNHAVFALQRTFCRRGVPFVIVPARV